MSTNPPTRGGDPTALGHLRVVELGEMPAAYCANFLGGLGADVVKVEPPGGDPNRWLPPFAGDIEDLERGLPFLNANLNKRSIVLDLAEKGDSDTLATLLAHADVLVEAGPPGNMAALGFDDQRLQELNSGLVTVSMTPFGQWGPNSSYRGGDAIVSAMSGVMTSQGDDTRAPVVLPCQISYQIGAIHGAYLALAGVRHRRRTGQGQRIDLSLQETLTYTFAGGVLPYSHRSMIMSQRGRGGGSINILPCKDGRYVLLGPFMPHHWHALTREWMKDPVLSQPEWDDLQYRTDNADVAYMRLGQLAAQFDAEEFNAECQGRKIPCSPINTVEEFATSEHMRERGWFQQVQHPVVGAYTAPGPPIRLLRTPYRISRPAPLLDQHRAEILAEVADRPPRQASANGGPQATAPKADAPMLEGVRLADVTRVLVGPIGTKFLGFYGAEVIKVESADLPAGRDPTNPAFSDTNRNKLSCTIDLRPPEGKELMRRLVAVSDILVDNFSAGVMERLSLGYEEMRRIKPDIIQIGMPGLGSTGPLGWWVAYGNQLQAYTGLTFLWGYPDSPMDAHPKGPMPDYIGAAFLALASVAALEYRDRSGEGQSIEIAMIDGQGALLGPALLDYTLNGRSWGSIGYREPLAAHISPFGCYQCRYPYTWIVIACESDDDWAKLVHAMGEPSWATEPRFAQRSGRQESRDELDRRLAEWTQGFTPHQALRLLQKAGVPAGIAMNSEQLYYDLHLRARGHTVEVEGAPWGRLTYQGLPGIPSLSAASASGPAPWIGDHNPYVFGQIFGLSAEEIAQGEASGTIR